MSHHLDSPLARQHQALDISDVYLFRGEIGTVFVMNVNPLSGPGGFDARGRYEFKIDTDGDAVEDRTYCLTFAPGAGEGRQSVDLVRLDGPAARERGGEGLALARGLTGEEIRGETGVRLWAGPAADPFSINGSVVGAVKDAVAHGTPLRLDGAEYGSASNLFAGTNVSAIVLEIPDTDFQSRAIGFWGVTALADGGTGWQQVNRCANPLINTIFNPDDSQRASDYDTSIPSEDRALYGALVNTLVAKAVAANRTSDHPEAHAERVVNAIFPDVLRYEIGTPAEYGFVVRNGRALTDSAAEVMLALVLNRAVALWLDSRPEVGTARAFPYLAPAL